MKIIFFTKYNKRGPSSRYRIYNYIQLLEKKGVDVELNYLLGDWYFDRRPNLSFLYFCGLAFFKRLLALLKVKNYDFVFIEYEFFPYFPSFFERVLKIFGVKYIVDYDDAIFHNYNLSNNFFIKYLFARKIDRVLKMASYVITGSPYLTEYALKYNKNVEEIPTSLDPILYPLFSRIIDDNVFTIGWIGSKTTSINLIDLIPVFHRLSNSIDFQINLIGFDSDLEFHFSGLNVNFISWSSNNEVKEILKFDLGIMPLNINPWNRGKCGFKLVQYMACGLPTISTPLEANIKINHANDNLFAINNIEWYEAIMRVFEERDFFRKVGKVNYDLFKKYYNIERNIEDYMRVFNMISFPLN